MSGNSTASSSVSEVVPSSQFYIDMPKFRNIDLSNPVYYSEEGEDAPKPNLVILY